MEELCRFNFDVHRNLTFPPAVRTTSKKRGRANYCMDLIPTRSVSFSSVQLILIILLLSTSTLASAKLSLTKQCGEIVCKPHSYCSSYDHQCKPCQEACDKEFGNYDPELCEKDCQDYLHDLFYMRKSLHNESASEEEKVRLYYDDIQEELFTLKILIMVTIIISTSVMIALFILVLYLKKSRNRLGISNPGWCWDKNEELELPVIYSNSKCFTLPKRTNTAESAPNLTNNSNNSVNNNMSRVSTPDVISRSEGAVPVTVLSVNKLPYLDPPPKTKSQNKFRREPSESTLPEYLGYDNPALAPSPTHI